MKTKGIRNLRVNKKAITLALAGILATVSLTGCAEYELAPKENYDIVGQHQITDDGLLTRGLIQNLNVQGEDFSLVAEYSCDDETQRAWRITSDKFLYLKVYTNNLPAGYEVYIDNIHIDTSIKSKYASVDGILQDTMDDRIHNAQMIGFPIGNDTCYYGVNAIEGCNNDFIQGTFYGYQGYSTGTIIQKRYTEADYKKLGVYANKLQIVYDLLVKGPNDMEFRNISVNTDFIVPVSDNIIEYEIDGVVKTK
jgi:hypothetical protein